MHPHKKCTQFTGIKRLTVTAVIVIQHGDDSKRHDVFMSIACLRMLFTQCLSC